MKKIIYQFIALSLVSTSVFAQANIYPAKKQAGTIAIVGGTIHVGNGKVIQNGTIIFSNGKITSVKEGNATPQDATVVNASGKQIYPGFIAPDNSLGLVDVESVRATRDAQETGTINPHVRSIIAYNTDSRVIATVRSNGTLLSQATPRGGVSKRAAFVRVPPSFVLFKSIPVRHVGKVRPLSSTILIKPT